MLRGTARPLRPPRSKSLCLPYATGTPSVSKTYTRKRTSPPVNSRETQAMSDIVFLALGVGGFGLMSLYAIACSWL